MALNVSTPSNKARSLLEPAGNPCTMLPMSFPIDFAQPVSKTSEAVHTPNPTISNLIESERETNITASTGMANAMKAASSINKNSNAAAPATIEINRIA